MAVLDDIKTLKNIPSADTSQDGRLLLLIRKAKTLIANYLNISTTEYVYTDEYGNSTTIEPIDIEATYPDAVAQCVIEALNRNGDEGLSQSMVGRQMQSTYELGVSEEVKTLLPAPFATMVNTKENYYNGDTYFWSN